MSRKKLHLSVGINDYPGSGNDLEGCVNDAKDMTALLRARGFEGTMLLDSAAHELRLLGVHGMAVRRYPALLRLVESGAVDPGRLIRRRIGLEDAPAAFAAMRGEGITVIQSSG